MSEDGKKLEKKIVVFSVGNEEFGVNITEVREILRIQKITHVPNLPDYVKGVINLRGSILVVLDLNIKLNLSTEKNSKSSRIVVIEVNNTSIGMIVDTANEVIKLASEHIKPAPPLITQKIDNDYIDGVGIIDERLLILLDLAKLLPQEELDEIINVQESTKGMVNSIEKDRFDTSEISKSTKPKVITKKKTKKTIVVKKATKKVKKSAINKIGHPVYKDVHSDFHFNTHEGKPLKNVHELLKYVNTLDEETFKEFVNEEKNDFYNWISHAVGDKTLAAKIEKINDQAKISKIIMQQLLHCQ